PPEAEKAYRFAVQTYSRLLEEFPDYGDYVWGVRESYSGLVNLLTSTRRSDEAIVTAGESIEFYENLRAKFPRTFVFRDLGAAHVLRARLLREAGRTREAIDALQQSVFFFEKLSAESLNPVRLDLVASSYQGLGELLKASGRDKEAQAIARQA